MYQVLYKSLRILQCTKKVPACEPYIYWRETDNKQISEQMYHVRW